MLIKTRGGGPASSIASGATGGPLYLTKNAAGAPPYSFAGDTDTGVDSYAANTLDFVVNGARAAKVTVNGISIGPSAGSYSGYGLVLEDTFAAAGYTASIQNLSTSGFGQVAAYNAGGYYASIYCRGSAASVEPGAAVLYLGGSTRNRIYSGNAEVQIGSYGIASPVAQILTLGQDSRAGTDTNVAGSSGTFRTSLGTGNAVGASLIFESAVPVGSGTGAQTYATRFRANNNNTSFADAAKGTTDTTGWLMIPSCAGTPTGVPASIPSGQIAMVFDTTAKKLWFYSAATWMKGQVTAVDTIWA